MTTVNIQKLETLTQNSIAEFSALRREPAWLQELRQAAWKTYEALPFPKREEEWKRLDLRGLDFPSLGFLTNGAQKKIALPPVPESWAAKGVRHLPILEAALHEETLVRPLLEQALRDVQTHKFLCLNLALFTEGFFLRVPPGVTLEEPLHHRVSFGDAGTSLFYANLIVLEPGSQLTYWEELTSPANPEKTAALMTGWNHFHLGENAELKHRKLQHLGTHVSHFAHETFHQERSSRLHQLSMSMGGRIAKTLVRTRLDGPGAENQMLGVLFGNGQQQFDHWAFQDHAAPDTKSNLEYRGVLKGSARSSFIGLVTIEKQAQRSDAYQSNRNLLLSREARADAIPKLEILADDVKCGHGSATGPVDEEQMFYLMTRGIPRPAAERMIVEAFFEPVLSKIPEGPVLEEVRTFLNAKLDE
jgi:Fe-S cluster assembly protein SufD